MPPQKVSKRNKLKGLTLPLRSVSAKTIDSCICVLVGRQPQIQDSPCGFQLVPNAEMAKLFFSADESEQRVLTQY